MWKPYSGEILFPVESQFLAKAKSLKANEDPGTVYIPVD